ncbi:hypothetical protein MPSYJ_09620 [Mycolicibacterium psychrotolerans]|uniref:Uncharacterized protein n=1 Tax=Mycolicibacterium psychrotolerans TaxID=216929 RepID=A0A7I7M5M7_9MYCO|nr:hypothetical protein MPSYJ_09620 [Mycolicibacterium psychrotolerans]
MRRAIQGAVFEGGDHAPRRRTHTFQPHRADRENLFFPVILAVRRMPRWRGDHDVGSIALCLGADVRERGGSDHMQGSEIDEGLARRRLGQLEQRRIHLGVEAPGEHLLRVGAFHARPGLTPGGQPHGSRQ